MLPSPVVRKRKDHHENFGDASQIKCDGKNQNVTVPMALDQFFHVERNALSRVW